MTIHVTCLPFNYKFLKLMTCLLIHWSNISGTCPIFRRRNMSPSPAAEISVPLLQERRPSEKQASVSGAVFNVSTSIIGAGIMSIPATLKVLGVVPALLLIMAVAWLVDISVELLLRFTNSGNSTTYAGVMKEAFGTVGSLVLQICIMINNFGCLTMYIIIMGKFYYYYYYNSG